MATVLVKQDAAAVAECAAELAAQSLQDAIDAYTQAVWLLSGGTAPLEAYKIISKRHKDTLNWQQVIVAIGDERIVPLGSPASNRQPIDDSLLMPLNISKDHVLWPDTNSTAEKAAAGFQSELAALPLKMANTPRINLAWLGMGEDGHTLSLFPENPGNEVLQAQDTLVIAVHDAPKPPSDRVSLSLVALAGIESCLIIVTGATKAPVIARALQGDKDLPVVQAVNAIEKAGGQVTWLLDSAAAGHAAV